MHRLQTEHCKARSPQTSKQRKSASIILHQMTFRDETETK